MKDEVKANVTDEVVVDTVETTEVVETETAAPAEKKRRGKTPTKAQIHCVEDLVSYVRGNANDAEVTKRVKEVISAKFAEQKELIIESMWPVISKATPKKQEWFTDNVTSKIRNARKPKF